MDMSVTWIVDTFSKVVEARTGAELHFILTVAGSRPCLVPPSIPDGDAQGMGIVGSYGRWHSRKKIVDANCNSKHSK